MVRRLRRRGFGGRNAHQCRVDEQYDVISVAADVGDSGGPAGPSKVGVQYGAVRQVLPIQVLEDAVDCAAGRVINDDERIAFCRCKATIDLDVESGAAQFDGVCNSQLIVPSSRRGAVDLGKEPRVCILSKGHRAVDGKCSGRRSRRDRPAVVDRNGTVNRPGPAQSCRSVDHQGAVGIGRAVDQQRSLVDRGGTRVGIGRRQLERAGSLLDQCAGAADDPRDRRAG